MCHRSVITLRPVSTGIQSRLMCASVATHEMLWIGNHFSQCNYSTQRRTLWVDNPSEIGGRIYVQFTAFREWRRLWLVSRLWVPVEARLKAPRTLSRPNMMRQGTPSPLPHVITDPSLAHRGIHVTPHTESMRFVRLQSNRTMLSQNVTCCIFGATCDRFESPIMFVI